MRLVLYGFRICPFVERTNILLNEKSISCERVYVDIRNKPDWFLKLSPLSKVPVLAADEKIIFESSVINELLDEISGSSLHPGDAIQKAHNRAWIEWGSALIFDAYHMTLAKNDDEFQEKCVIVETKLKLLEDQFGSGPFFNGQKFSMIDIAYAPLFKRFDCLLKLFSIDGLKKFTKLAQWSSNILDRRSVVEGFAVNFDEEFRVLLKIKDSFLKLKIGDEKAANAKLPSPR